MSDSQKPRHSKDPEDHATITAHLATNLLLAQMNTLAGRATGALTDEQNSPLIDPFLRTLEFNLRDDTRHEVRVQFALHLLNELGERYLAMLHLVAHFDRSAFDAVVEALRGEFAFTREVLQMTLPEGEPPA